MVENTTLPPQEIAPEMTPELPQELPQNQFVPDYPVLPPPKHFLQTRASKVIGFCVFVITASLAGYVLSKQPAVQRVAKQAQEVAIKAIPILNPSPVPSPSPDLATPTPAALSVLADSVDSQRRIAFLKMKKVGQASLGEAWTILPDGSDPQKYDIPELYWAYKQPDSSLLFYTATTSANLIHVKNLNSSEESTLQPITHPDEKVRVAVQIPSLDEISPDGKYFFFNVSFDKQCPEPSPGTQPSEGGPCMPDELPELPSGRYFYDMTAQTSTYVPIADARVADWDMPHQKVYLINSEYKKSGLEEYDLKTHSVKRVNNAESFGYGAYQIPNTSKLVIINAATGNDGSQSYSKISIFDQKTNETKEFDSGKWADVQPFASVSPDQKYVLYEKTVHREDGKYSATLHRYNLATGEATQISPANDQEGYTVQGVWIDNQTFVTSVDTVEQGTDYTNVNNFLVSFDVVTGKMTRLTPENDVYRFTRF